MTAIPLEDFDCQPLFVTPRHETIYAYWREKRGAAPFPDRRALDPVDIPGLLPYLVLYDVLDGGEDFRVRLQGGSVRERMRTNYTGRRLSEFPHLGPGGRLFHCLQSTARDGRPRFNPKDVPYVGPDESVVAHQGLVLPFGEAGEQGGPPQVTLLVALVEFQARWPGQG